MSDIIEEEITLTGTLINITLFEDKIMRNFLIISNKLRRLEGSLELEQKQKALEKEFKFLTMKVETSLEKMPKDSGSVTRTEARNIAKEAMFDVLNSHDKKLTESKFNQDISAEINAIKEGISNLSVKGSHPKNKKDTSYGSKASFTAGQILRDSEKDREKETVAKVPR